MFSTCNNVNNKSDLNDKEMNCLHNCVGRYTDTLKLVSETINQRIQSN